MNNALLNSFSSKQILLVDDEEMVTKSLSQTLSIEKYESISLNSAQAALPLIEKSWNGIIISDINMPEMDGIEFLQAIHTIDKEIPVIILTAFGNVPNVVNAMQQGAYDFLEKPFSTEQLIDTVTRAIEKRRLTIENRILREQVESHSRPGPTILGDHPKMIELRSLLNTIKNANTDILVHGETGTGKELVARYLHQTSNRKEGRFVAINCGAIAQSLMDSELFGHEAGSFTGAEKQRIGKIEYANGGTLFLDEIESMPMEVQINLLRVLEERKLTRVGSNKEIDFDIRIIAATKENLKEKAEKGEFRLDLYYRLNVLEVNIPPLRERSEDILMLFDHFVWIAANRFKTREIKPLTANQKQRLLSRQYSGNVRELRNMAESYVLIGAKSIFGKNEDDDSDNEERLTLHTQMNTYEAMIIRKSLLDNQGKLNLVRDELGLARKTLYEKMRKYDLQKEDFKNK
ncbi:MAG: sigma-54-dependent transcriptional regulator [Arenicella sp.]